MTDPIRVACVSESETDAEWLTDQLSGEGGRIDPIKTLLHSSTQATIESIVESNFDCIVFDHRHVSNASEIIREVRRLDYEFPVLVLVPEDDEHDHGIPLTTLTGATDYVLLTESDDEWKTVLSNRVQNAARMYLRGRKNDTHEEREEQQRDLINDISSVLEKEVLPHLHVSSEHVRISLRQFSEEEETGDVVVSDPERTHNNLLNAQDSLSHLLSLIDSLHTLSVTGVDVNDAVSVSLREFATDVWDGMEEVSSHSCTLDVEPNLTVEASPVQLSRLFRHAFKLSFDRYSSGGGDDSVDEVRFTVNTLPNSDGFYVQDNVPLSDTAVSLISDDDGLPSSAVSGINHLIVEHVSESHNWEMSLVENPDGGLRHEFVVA